MILDLILLGVFALVIFIYVWRGFAKSVWGLVRVTVSAICAWIFGKIVSSWLYGTVIFSGVSAAVEKAIGPMISKVNGSFNLTELFEKLPAEFTELIARSGADISALQEKFGEMSTATEEELAHLAKNIAEPLASTLSDAAGYVIVFLVAFVIMSIIWVVIDRITKLPVIKDVNKTLGGILGAIVGLCYLWIISLIITIIVKSSALGDTAQLLASLSESSYIVRLFVTLTPFDAMNSIPLFRGNN